MKAHFQRLMQHADWANRRVLELLQTTRFSHRRSLQLFAHVLAAEQIYLERIRGLDPWPQHFWPELSIEECAALVEKNRLAYEKFFEVLSEYHLDTAVKYRNSKGSEFQTPIKDLLSHVALHGAYHRGQIALLIRDSGSEPINTDFIIFTRETN